MRARGPCWTTVALLVALTAAACSSTSATQTETSARPATETAADPEGDPEGNLEALYWARQDSARMAFTEADVRFMAGMIGHHAQALIMSRLAPTHGASESVQTLAARIINAQQDEIETMQRWLRERGQPVPEVHIDGLNLMVHGGGHHDHTGMPGMLTQAQLEELDAARGTEFDRLFLTYMIQHHGGAVVMVDDLFGTDGAAQDGAAFKLAADIHADQTTEIARMKSMLASLDGASQDP